MGVTRTAFAAAAIALIAGSAQAVTCTGSAGQLRTLTASSTNTPPATLTCQQSGLGNIQNADILALYPTATIVERDAANSNGGLLSITGEGGHSGTWSILASLFSTYANVYMGFHFGNGGNVSASNPDWFIVQVAGTGNQGGTWAQNADQWGLSNIVVFGTGTATSTSSGGTSGNVPEPASTALVGMGLGLLGLGFARRRKGGKSQG